MRKNAVPCPWPWLEMSCFVPVEVHCLSRSLLLGLLFVCSMDGITSVTLLFTCMNEDSRHEHTSSLITLTSCFFDVG